MDVNEYINFIEDYSERLLFKRDRYNISDPLCDSLLLLNDSIKYIDIKRSIMTEHEIRKANLIHIPSIEKLNIDKDTKLFLTAIYLDVLNVIGKKELIICHDKYDSKL